MNGRTALGGIWLFAALGCATAGPQPMSDARLAALIEPLSSAFEARPGLIRFTFDGVEMACISDTAANRMRIVSPVARLPELDAYQLQIMLIANYHTTLDARYAISEEIVYAAFVHPLSPLSDDELRSALRQVASLARTFGTTYSSGELVFGGGDADP